MTRLAGFAALGLLASSALRPKRSPTHRLRRRAGDGGGGGDGRRLRAAELSRDRRCRGRRRRQHRGAARRRDRRASLDSAHAKAYTAASFKADTLALSERAKGEDGIAPLAKLPHVMFFGGGVPIKLGDEMIGAIGAAGAPGAKLDDGCARAGIDKIRDRLK